MDRRALAVVLVLAACSGDPRPPVPPVDLGSREGLAFPDVVQPGDRATADRPPPSDRRTEKPRPGDARGERAPDRNGAVDLAAADHKGPDLLSACFYDWAKWSCTTSTFNLTCTANCGGFLQVKCSAVSPFCTCTKNGVSHTCATPGAPTCAPCQAAMKSGCCSF